jgi:hypothetical protein
VTKLRVSSQVTVSTVFLLAPFQPVTLNELLIFFFKSFLAMMLALIRDVFANSIDIRVRD